MDLILRGARIGGREDLQVVPRAGAEAELEPGVEGRLARLAFAVRGGARAKPAALDADTLLEPLRTQAPRAWTIHAGGVVAATRHEATVPAASAQPKSHVQPARAAAPLRL